MRGYWSIREEDMGYKGRVSAVSIVIAFNLIRYFYYHQYMGFPFEASFFILTTVFLIVAWIGGRQFDQAKFYAEKDPLTNTYNRRTIESEFKKHAIVCKRENKKLGVVLIDLDKFKMINDNFGHHKGDELLRYVAVVIKETAKKNDVIVRWGGDEFVHIIPNVKADFKSTYVQKLKRELAKPNHLSLPSIEASIGIAIYPDEGESFEVLIQQADAAMYEMKPTVD